jgi:hypothetical protein
MSLTDAQCAAIAEWTLRQRIPGVPDVKLVVTRAGHVYGPTLDDERREVRMSAEDDRDLRSWIDRQAP